MPCKHHNPFLNAEYEKQDLDHEELAESIKRVKDSVEKLEVKTSADLTREAENLTRSINQTAETAHQELQDSVHEVSQNINDITEQLDTDVTVVNNKVDNAVTTLNSSISTTESRINARVDNIIANNSSTEGNSELIDIRTGADGTVYQTAGLAVRTQVSKLSDRSLMLKTLESNITDLNNLTDMGIYYHSTMDDMPMNSPFSSNIGFMIIVFEGDGPSKLYQKIISYTDNTIYVRGCKVNGTWNPWKSLAAVSDIESMLNTYSVTNVNNKDVPVSAASLDSITDSGVYYLTSDDNLTNKPTGSGVLVVYTDTNSPTTRCYQTWINYSDLSVYVRNRVNSSRGWRDWREIASLNSAFHYDSLAAQENVENLNSFSAYYVSTGTGLPTGASGLILNFRQPDSTTRAYQVYMPYNSNDIYFRHMVSGAYGTWKRVLTEDDLNAIAKQGRIVKNSTGSYSIYFGGYTANLDRVDDNEKNAHLWNITSIYKGSSVLVPSGTDIIGPIKEDGESDFAGGIHGDEINTAFAIYTDGTPYDMESTVNFDSLDICMISNIQRVSTKENVFTRTVNIHISGNEMKISNQYKALEDNITVHRATNGGLIAVRNNILNGIYMNNYFSDSAPTQSISNSTHENTIAKLFTSLGTITVENIIGHESDKYKGYWAVFTNENPVRTKCYFDVVSSDTIFNTGDLITGVFKYTFC